MLAGDADDLTPAAQVFNAEQLLGTPQNKVVKKLVPGGHIGLFMERKTLEDTWPEICEWILSHDTLSNSTNPFHHTLYRRLFDRGRIIYT